MRITTSPGMVRPAVLSSLLFLAVLAFLLATGPDTAVARSGFLGEFNTMYSTAGTPLDSCSLCHTNVPATNSYGTDWTNNGKDFAAIEGIDSDGDGWTNAQEIEALKMPGDPADHPTPSTTTTQPPPPTTQPPPPTTQPPPPTTQPPPPTTLPPPGDGPLDVTVEDLEVPATVDVTQSSVTRNIRVKAEVNGVEEDEDVTAQIQLWANGQLVETITQTREAEDDGEVEYEVDFDFTFTAAHVPQVEFWGVVVVAGQGSSPRVGVTTVNGPAPPTTSPPTTTLPPTTTQPATPTTKPPPGPPTTQPPVGVDGAAVYAAACAGCHGADGSGGFGGPVAGTAMNLSQVISITADGSGGMPGFAGQLSSAEIEAVSEYVLMLGAGAVPAPTTTTTSLPPGTPPDSGAALYRRHCAGCHGAQAGGGPGGALVGSNLSFSQQVSVTAQGRGSMPGFSSTLSAGEIESIVRYVMSLGGADATVTTTAPPAEESGAAIYLRLCAGCHGADGAGGPGGAIVGSDLGGSALESVIRDGVGTMPGFATQLDDSQVSRLASFVAGLIGGPDGAGLAVDSTEVAADDPEQGLAGHVAESGGGAASGLDGVVASSPGPGNPLGWTLALAIAAFLIALGSAITGAMPKEVDEGRPG